MKNKEHMAQILIVEDSSDYRELLSNFLEHAGCLVTAAVDGAQAIAAVKQHAYFFAGMVFVLGAAATEQAGDLFGAGYFASYPLLLPVGNDGEPGFVMELSWLGGGEGNLCLAGAGLLAVSIRYAGRKRTKA